MASLFGSWGADPFGEMVEKATSELLPAGQEDIALNLEICDQVRSKQVPPKQAMQTIKKRLSHKNPNVVLLALGLTDICIKNGGDHFLAEVASKEFMDNLESILRAPGGPNYDVKTKALKLIQDWAQISESKPQQMGYIIDTYKSLKFSGFDFPASDPNNVVSAALVETLTAPEWTDSDVCMRCRTTFTTFNRKHHCRNCGNVFCQDCSSKTMALPWFGVGQDVRVCEGCFMRKAPPKVTNDGNAPKISRSKSNVVPSGRGGVGSHQRSNTLGAGSSTNNRSSARKKEEDDLALAIKLSLEASGGSAPSQPDYNASQSSIREGRPTRQADGRMMEGTDADDDPDLAAAIAASLRDYAPPQPSAPDDDGRATPRTNAYSGQTEGSSLPLPPSLELPASDVDSILTFSQNAFSQERFARQNGRWQVGPGQQQLHSDYERATTARPRVAKSLDEATRRQGVLVSMHDKLSEAVRLYDSLLDAQMSRPTYTAYGNHPQIQNNYYAPQQDVRHANHQHLSNPNYQYSPQAFAGSSSRAPEPVSSLYPVPPSAPYGLNDASHESSGQSSLGYAGPESPNPYAGRTQQYFAPHESRQPATDQSYAHPQRSEYAYNSEIMNGQQLPSGQDYISNFNGQAQYDNQAGVNNGITSPSTIAYQRYNEPTYTPNAIPSAPYSPGQSMQNKVYLQQGQDQSQLPNQPPHLDPSQAAHYAPLHDAVTQMTISAPPLESPSVYESSENANYAQYPNAPPMNASTVNTQDNQQISQNVNKTEDEWQPVPIIDSSASSMIASAPPPPQNGSIDNSSRRQGSTTYLNGNNVNLPSVPSAPIASPPSAKYASSNQNAIPITYDGMISPSQQHQQQQQQMWTKPVETPLIDL
jgi:hepatocyte growth factor-regulated tyrosine kinase substrate